MICPVPRSVPRQVFQKLYSGNDWQERVATAILGPLPDDDSDDAETMLR